MDLNLLFFTGILAFLVAKLEINIEGKYGWAEKLPTRKIKNKITDLLLGGAPLTGYHFWLFLTILFLLHLPFFLGLTWNLAGEFKLLGFFFVFLIIEDFLWFILNPAFGIRKFTKTHIHWHKNWIGFLPKNYYLGIFLSLGSFIISNFINN